ncbi:MAG: hypothetical protein V3T70_06885 [Phycisphaerae bacterium]
MTKSDQNSLNSDWERVHAPQPSAARWYTACAAFGIWGVFLTVMAVHRWVLTLQ